MTRFCEVVKANNRYFKATEVALDYFFKLMATDESIAAWASNNKPTFAWIEKWLMENQTPPNAYSQSKVKMYKTGNIAWGGASMGSGGYREKFMDRKSKIDAVN
ncbi:MAG: hypothetical protein V2I33_19720, partial [Kangiellaceae bacterium]|nr:hypothetical protein [Kangiellaceae bacterium]